MNKSHSHKKLTYVAPAGILPVIERLIDTYKVWHDYLPHFSKTSRYTLGEKIDSLLIEIMEFSLLASYTYKTQKIPYVQQAIVKLDLLKFFLQIAWEIKAFDNKRYIILSERLNEVGRMLGGWLKQLTKENSTG